MKPQHLGLRLLQLARPELKTLIVATLFLIIASATQLAFPQALRAMIDQALVSRNKSLINEASLVILIVFIIQAVASTFRYFLFTLAGERIVLRLRSSLYSHILNQEIAFFDSHKTGDLMSRISTDTAVVQNAVSVNISMGLRNFAGALGGLILMIYTSPVLALSMLLVIPPVAFGAAYFGKRIRTYSKAAQEALSEASTIAEETISGVRTVRSFAQEDFEKNRYSKSLESSLVAVRAKVVQISLFMSLASVVGYGAIAAVVWFGGHDVIDQKLSVGDLTQFLIYLLMVAFSVGALGGLWGDFMSALGAAKRLFEVLDKAPLILQNSGLTPEFCLGKVQFKNVNFSYPVRSDLPVIKSLNLVLESGQVVALVGSSGGGKSTLVALLLRYYDVQSGEIFIDNHEIKTLNPHWLRSQIGVVSQEPILISSSIEENIRYAQPKATLEQVISAAKLAYAHDFILNFPEGYKTLVGERGIQLSGGQKQRIAIARALLKNPKILILDEATSALDTESEHFVQSALTTLMKGRTTLVIAHRLATVQLADLICILDHGTIIESGHHDQLILNKQSLYYKLIERQL